ATYGDEQQERVGFVTDTSVCIGCKACEVACKEWNVIPEDGRVWTGESYDHTSQLGANTWRHVAFVEQQKPLFADGNGGTGLRWLMESDVCKHCTHAACLDVCPTGALFRTEFGTVVVQQDICNGCGYCVPACPFGVLDKRHLAPAPDLPAFAKENGRVWKCTLCYDRLKGGHEPACAKACPTKSIQFGPLEELRERAAARLAGNEELARTSLYVGAVADLVSPALLISDLGRPERFHHMLRVVKVTSPMNLGSWVLLVNGGASTTAAVLELLGRLKPIKVLAEAVATLAGPPLATYTGVLIADTAVPVWHDG